MPASDPPVPADPPIGGLPPAAPPVPPDTPVPALPPVVDEPLVPPVVVLPDEPPVFVLPAWGVPVPPVPGVSSAVSPEQLKLALARAAKEPKSIQRLAVI
jgi:hypothetical protein